MRRRASILASEFFLPKEGKVNDFELHGEMIMNYEVNGNTIEANANGYLVNIDDWNEDVAKAIAAQEGISELTARHWDLVNYLRDEYVNNAGSQPNMRNIVKAMQAKWGDKTVEAKTLYELFPLNPDKQGSKVAGLPESKRKGGY
jgi:tRNA 2-thiouridine synthesizing protein E